ncbi:DUF4221 family protein [Mucilaginibacter psychrotolerans]|uniref:DUF4221 domain-containing protein n=1 Tax=Mucilaginibacter psychrotolerans TaxID=1524096 RepID=A0A4Y8SH00_9SPHI|nr:DUF4221 family protein [Mucilaginibacter psychrotolerans]TFF37915.1 DUF4221 domain-containing protein [Mucilaginibacter psychrotolerans]
MQRFEKFRINILISLFIAIVFWGCNSNINSLKIQEKEVAFKVVDNPFKYASFSTSNDDYVAFLTDSKVNVYGLNNAVDHYSVNLDFLTSPYLKERYGDVNSFCFNGRDSLFVLTTNALLFLVNGKAEKIVLINSLSKNENYKTVRFANLDRSPIYYDSKSGRIIGRIYCHVCGQTNKSFYEQPQLAGISIQDGSLKIYDVPFSEIYQENYYGFSNEVNITNSGQKSIISYSADPNFYIYNRATNALKSISAKGNSDNAIPLEISKSGSAEAKIKAMITNPMYTEVRYDKYRKLYYRFLLSPIPLKSDSGKYNTLENKPLVLTVYNEHFKIAGEFPLDTHYREFISFVTKNGLYIFYRTENNANYKFGYFKILTFENEV